MPGRSGFEMIEAIRKSASRAAGLPVVALSAAVERPAGRLRRRRRGAAR
jgi:CheY-like chemotaxis protein